MKKVLSGVLLLMTWANSAPAAIVHSGLQNLSVSAVDLEGVYINFETGEIAALFPDDFYEKPWINITLGGYGIFNADVLRPIAVTGGASYDPDALTDHYVNVPEGTTIDVSSLFVVDGWASQNHIGSSGDPDKFVVGEAGFLAFVFTNTDSATTHYGWLQFVPGNDSGTIVDWAFEDVPDASIQVGAVPEPSMLFTAAVSVAGLLSRRRR